MTGIDALRTAPHDSIITFEVEAPDGTKLVHGRLLGIETLGSEERVALVRVGRNGALEHRTPLSFIIPDSVQVDA